MTRAATPVQGRWAARPVLGAALRLLVLLAPVALGLGAALLLSRVLPAPTTGGGTVGWWLAVLGGSAAVVFASDRIARRALPLAVLLELSLIFPDRAPSRLRAARTASVRDVETRLARLRSQGVAMQPYDAAETVVTLVGILGLHDKRTRGHSERVRAYTDLLTTELGLDEEARVRLRWAALVHDLGKLSIPPEVLNSSGRLDEQGWALMHRHPDEGVRLLGGLLPWLGEWGDAVGQHHERYDGLGYPNGLAGEEISYAARIVSLADSFEVMTSGRSYKASRSAAWARAELTRCAGSQFDPALVRAFLGISLGRLRWVLGPVTWLAELPFVATADRAGQAVKVASVTALAAGVLGTGVLLPDLDPLEPQPGTRTFAVDEPRPVAAEEPAPARTSSPSPRAAQVRLSPSRTAGPPASSDSRTGRAGETGRAAGGPAGDGGTSTSRPAPAARPTEQPAPAAAPRPVRADPGPAVLPPAYHLTAKGLQPQPQRTQQVVPVPVGGVRVFDARVDRAVEVPAQRDLVLFVRFATRQGNAKVVVRLLDCPPGGSGCTELSTGLATQDKAATDEYQPHTVALSQTGEGAQRVAAGRVLRLEIAVWEPGAKGPARLALGSAATPSRLRLG